MRTTKCILEVDFAQNIGCHGNTPRDRKNNLRSFIYGQSSTNAANFMKIGHIEVEIVGETKITKNILKI